jgi:hypothetical protein
MLALTTAAFLVGGAAVRQGETDVVPPAQAEPSAPPIRFLTGPVSETVRGDLTIRVPEELRTTLDDRFDLLVHFHGIAPNQSTNVDKAKLSVVVVSVNDGAFSDAYAKAFTAPEALSRVVRAAEQEVGARRNPALHVGRIALSAWSAGGAAVGKVLAHDADRVDAVIVADGLFSYWLDAAKTAVAKPPLQPFVDFGRKAMNEEKLFILTHTAIPTDYPNVEACTSALLDELGLERGPARPTPEPLGGNPTYAVDHGSFHVRGTDGTGAPEHIAQLRALDEPYAALRERWER